MDNITASGGYLPAKFRVGNSLAMQQDRTSDSPVTPSVRLRQSIAMVLGSLAFAAGAAAQQPATAQTPAAEEQLAEVVIVGSQIRGTKI
ncbi:MAG: hypothetical protein ACK58T_02475, partial [Phycisphaerae bacterium]